MTDNDATLIEQLLDGDEWRHMEIRAIAANRLEALVAENEGFRGRFEKDQDRIACQAEQLAAMRDDYKSGYWRKCHEIAEATNKALRSEIYRLQAKLAEWEKQNKPGGWIQELRDEAKCYYALKAQGEPVNKTEASEAYDVIDHFLRNNLDDSDYSEYSSALETIWNRTTPQPADRDDERLNWIAGI